MKNLFLFLVLPFLVGCSTRNNYGLNNAHTRYVDPMIGTGGHGHTYPGASVPFGMVQVNPVNGISGWDWCSGYHASDSVIVGFSHLNLSGTGIGDLADILLMPAIKAYDLNQIPLNPRAEKENSPAGRNQITYKSSYKNSSETSKPGYYSVYLDDPQVFVELTAANRVGYQRYTFQENVTPSVILNLALAINWDKALQTKITKKDDYTITGYRFSKGWAPNQKTFFAMKFSKPLKNIQFGGRNNAQAAQFFFEADAANKIVVKTAISSVSEGNALLNLNSVKDEVNFDEIKQKSNDLWEDALRNIQVKTKNDTLKTIFYSALYHTKLAPVTFSDVNGEFRLENDEIAKINGTAYSTFSLWDTFRTEHPLLNFTDTDRIADMINSMLAYYEVRNILPVWTLYANETNTMTGYHSVAVIAEAYMKGIRGFDAEKAYKAMKTTMMQDERGLDFYKEYGYIPYDKLDESVTITLEYAYNDYCLAQMAKALGKEEDYQYFMNRSKAYQHLFDPETEFMRGKSSDKISWNVPFDPKKSNHREHTDYTEGNAWQHSWFVLHDVEGFVNLFKSKDNFINKLEQLFTESSEITGDNISADITGLIGQYAHGNEPSHHIAYLFNKIGQPWRTQYFVNKILKTQYSAQKDGYSGNEDCGQMSAWYVMSSMGLYPMNPVSAEYEITSPMFESVQMKLQNGKTFKLETENFSPENIYIKNAYWNGKPIAGTSITHQEILSGGTLKLILSNQPNKSGTLN